MKSKLILYLLVLICFISFLLTSHITWGISAVDPDTDIIILNYKKVHGKSVFGPLRFTHKKHYVDYNLSCIQCHHAWKTEQRKDPVKCMECHQGKDRGKRQGRSRNVNDNTDCCSLKDAFHLSCMECHKIYQKMGYIKISATKWNELTIKYPKLKTVLNDIMTTEDNNHIIIDLYKFTIIKKGFIGQKAYNELLAYLRTNKRQREKNIIDTDYPPVRCKNCHQ